MIASSSLASLSDIKGYVLSEYKTWLNKAFPNIDDRIQISGNEKGIIRKSLMFGVTVDGDYLFGYGKQIRRGTKYDEEAKRLLERLQERTLIDIIQSSYYEQFSANPTEIPQNVRERVLDTFKDHEKALQRAESFLHTSS